MGVNELRNDLIVEEMAMRASLPAWRWLFSNQFRTDTDRAIKALLTTVPVLALGGPLITFRHLTGPGFYDLPIQKIIGDYLSVTLVAAIPAALLAAPVLVVAALGWWVLELSGQRSPATAMGFGAVLAGMMAALLFGSLDLVWILFGAGVGGLVWVVAYRPRGAA
jgi:hypothetical protein